MGGVAVMGTIAAISLSISLAASSLPILLRAHGYEIESGACSSACGQAAVIASPVVPPEPDTSCVFPADFGCVME